MIQWRKQWVCTIHHVLVWCITRKITVLVTGLTQSCDAHQTQGSIPAVTCDGLGLGVHHLLCGSSLPLLQLLSDAGDHPQVTLQGVGHLLTNQLVALPEHMTPLRVAQNHPLHATVLYHRRAEEAREGDSIHPLIVDLIENSAKYIFGISYFSGNSHKRHWEEGCLKCFITFVSNHLYFYLKS